MPTDVVREQIRHERFGVRNTHPGPGAGEQLWDIYVNDGSGALQAGIWQLISVGPNVWELLNGGGFQHFAVFDGIITGVLQTLKPNGTVTAILTYTASIKPSSGNPASSNGPMLPNSSVDIYDDGAGNVLTLTVTALGAIQGQVTAGAKTFDCAIILLWK